ncbi:unnamed protein product [Paramecium primaurelia]|uniref:Protein kinase domain-containing protein n=1 Tax=Paramecium primaurelia TaxID=5886 RepID=A0A8S1PS65_PARPR|nr:unnamed protein product [Paramecium primaurelia]
MSCLRKHLLKSKTYYLEVLQDQMILSEHKTMQNPKYVVQFNFESRVMWKKSEHEQLCCFGILYQKRIKWFWGDHKELNLLKMYLSNRVFFGNISIFYESSQIIGSGASSKVCLVKRNTDVLYYAAKCISKKYLTGKKSNDRIARLQSEIEILQKIDNPIFVKLLEIYEGDNSYYLITDYYEGDTLYNFIRNTQSDTLPSYIVRDGIKTLLLGLQYLESLGLIHRDIKLENILLAKQNEIKSLKIIDFGLAIYENLCTKLSVCGTPGYIAPEILRVENQQNEYFTTKCDVFSAGVIFYKLLTKRTLFRAENTADIMKANTQCDIHLDELQLNVQKEALNLLKLMLEPNPKLRPTASQCLEHPYFYCQLEDIRIIQEILDKVTGCSEFTKEQHQDTHSVPNESQAAQIKRCPPTQYRVRIEQRKRTRSPRKYADFQFYLPSFCQMTSFESEGNSSNSSKSSRIENIIINEKESEKDSVIEENNKFQQ